MLIAGLVLLGPTILSRTAEWKAYTGAIAKRPCVSVEVMWYRSDNGGGLDGGRFTVSNDGWALYEGQSSKTRWNGKSGLRLDTTSNTWTRVSQLDLPVLIAMLDLLPNDSSLIERVSARLERTRDADKPKQRQVGWEVDVQGRDYGFTTTYWFDPKTHLPSQISHLSEGMVGDPGLKHSRYVHWNLKATLPAEERSLTPPKGFVEAKPLVGTR